MVGEMAVIGEENDEKKKRQNATCRAISGGKGKKIWHMAGASDTRQMSCPFHSTHATWQLLIGSINIIRLQFL